MNLRHYPHHRDPPPIQEIPPPRWLRGLVTAVVGTLLIINVFGEFSIGWLVTANIVVAVVLMGLVLLAMLAERTAEAAKRAGLDEPIAMRGDRPGWSERPLDGTQNLPPRTG